jgi:hypothetical protein
MRVGTQSLYVFGDTRGGEGLPRAAGSRYNGRGEATHRGENGRGEATHGHFLFLLSSFFIRPACGVYKTRQDKILGR